MDPNTIFIMVVSVVMALGIIATFLVYLSDYLQKSTQVKHKPA